MTLESVLAALYASEINCGIDSFWDGGWRAWVGDDTNGRLEERGSLALEELPLALHEMALKRFPNSEYAKTAGRGAEALTI